MYAHIKTILTLLAGMIFFISVHLWPVLVGWILTIGGIGLLYYLIHGLWTSIESKRR